MFLRILRNAVTRCCVLEEATQDLPLLDEIIAYSWLGENVEWF
jgi:hypothetical protein